MIASSSKQLWKRQLRSYDVISLSSHPSQSQSRSQKQTRQPHTRSIQFITVKRNSALLSQYSRIKIIQMFPYFTTISNEPSTVLSSLHSHSFEIRGLCWNLNLFFMAVRTLQLHPKFSFRKYTVGPVRWSGQPCFYWYKF